MSCKEAHIRFLGDLQRPTCSRCMEARWNCVYSSTKKRPGPATGSRQKMRSASKMNKETNLNGLFERPMRADVFSEDVSHGVSGIAPGYPQRFVTQSGSSLSQSALSQSESVNTAFPPSGSVGSPGAFLTVHPMSSTDFGAGSLEPQFTSDQEATL